MELIKDRFIGNSLWIAEVKTLKFAAIFRHKTGRNLIHRRGTRGKTSYSNRDSHQNTQKGVVDNPFLSVNLARSFKKSAVFVDQKQPRKDIPSIWKYYPSLSY